MLYNIIAKGQGGHPKKNAPMDKTPMGGDTKKETPAGVS